MQMILIAADQFYQHPDNPRKNLGDISELTESIKKQGIMQNHAEPYGNSGTLDGLQRT